MEKQLCSLAAQRMRSEMTELLSLLPAARRDPALDEPGAYALDCAALCAYRCLRDAQNISAWGTLHSPPRRPVCVSACAEAFVHAAAAVCPGIRFSYVPPVHRCGAGRTRISSPCVWAISSATRRCTARTRRK